MTTNRERLLQAFNNEPVDRVPVGFWFHFLPDGDERYAGLERSELIAENIEGHKKYIQEFDPDFVKIMSDGYFGHPSLRGKKFEKPEDLLAVEPLPSDHPWIKGQVALVKEVVKAAGKERSSFYNIFSPLTVLRQELSNAKVGEFFKTNPKIIQKIVNIFAQDQAEVARRVITEGGAEGIYLSVQTPEDQIISGEDYTQYIRASEDVVLAAANALSQYSILHICGYRGHKNDVKIWQDAEAAVINWAVTFEPLSLEEGKQIFAGRAVIGGFNNNPGELLDAGSKEEIEAETERLLNNAGKIGVILGADCTVPSTIDIARLNWVRRKAASL